MLRERKARSCSYDAALGTATLEVGSGGGPGRDAEATVLLDASGALVGVDVEPGAPERTVIMVGTHEAVALTRSAKVSVSRDASGEIASVVVTGVSPQERP